MPFCTDKQTTPCASLRFLANSVSSGFGSGKLPFAPGTCGSLAALIVWCALQGMVTLSSLAAQICACVLVIVIGTVAIWESLRHLSEDDPGWIVIDEWAGMFIALIATNPHSLSQMFGAFIAFRLFDIIKPGPVRLVERTPGALGVMLDDIVAGVFAWIVVQGCTPLAQSSGLAWGGPGLW